jgi:hypothetical protein
MADFKHGNRFSSLSVHLKRRPSVSLQDGQALTPKMRTLRSEVDDDNIRKVNETARRLFPNEIVTWAQRSSDSVQVPFIMSDREYRPLAHTPRR